jgi:hypothetical protein
MVKKSRSRNEHRAWREPLQAAAAREIPPRLGQSWNLEHCRVFLNLPRHRLRMHRNIGTAFFIDYSVKIMLDSLAASCLNTVVKVDGIECGK